MRSYLTHGLACLGALAAIAFGSPAVAETKIDPSWPQWLQEAMAKEHRKVRTRRLSLGPIETVMPGKITTREDLGDGIYYAVADDKSGAPVQCWFYTEPMDLATSTASISEAVIAATAEQHGPVANRQIFHVGAGAVDGSPFLALEWVYTVGEAPNALVAFSKVRAAERGDGYVICSHSQLGYRDSFAEGFAEVVSNLDVSTDANPPYYSEISVFNLNGIDVGIAYVTMTRDDEGDTGIYTTEAMLMPVSSAELTTSDSTSTSWSTPDGYLINKNYAEGVNGELVTNLSVQFGAEDSWQVEGTFSGKAISADLGAEGNPISILGEMLTVRSLMQNPDANRADVVSWIPTADPTTFTPVSIVLDDEVPGTGTVTIGPLQAAGEFDENGSMSRGTIDMGVVKLLVKRAFVSGEIR